MGCSMYMLWTCFGCLILFINSVVWNNNVMNSAPVWCDMSNWVLSSGSQDNSNAVLQAFIFSSGLALEFLHHRSASSIVFTILQSYRRSLLKRHRWTCSIWYTKIDPWPSGAEETRNYSWHINWSWNSMCCNGTTWADFFNSVERTEYLVLTWLTEYIVQSYRFIIYEQVGCFPFSLNTPLEYFLILMWPVLIGCISLFYAG